MLDEGGYPHQSALARGEGVSAAAVSAALRKLGSADEQEKFGASKHIVVQKSE